MENRDSVWLAVFRALRPHQWTKNLLVFVPMVLAQRFSFVTLTNGAIAFAAFCACASGVYVVNDLLDVESDRQHPTKRHRPIPSGALSPRLALWFGFLLFCSAGALAYDLGPSCVALLAFYVAMNLLYSKWLKREPLLDVMALAGMYGLRLETGAVATGVILSPWLLAFSLFFFMSLALAKRYVEIRQSETAGLQEVCGRGYRPGDADLLLSLGPASGYVAALVLALYMNSDQMRSLYGDGRTLWVLCPLVLYWITRVWLLAKRGDLHDDPVVFALTDRASIAIAGLTAVVLGLATFFA